MPGPPTIAILSLMGLLVLWLMITTLWRNYRIARLRQDLFDIRGRLRPRIAYTIAVFSTPGICESANDAEQSDSVRSSDEPCSVSRYALDFRYP